MTAFRQKRHHPVNDDVLGAIPISCPEAKPFDNTGATAQPDKVDPGHVSDTCDSNE